MVMGEAGRITGFKFESLHTILEEKVFMHSFVVKF